MGLKRRRKLLCLASRGRSLDDELRRDHAEREREEVLIRLYRATQEERLRLARDLHDQAGQHIVGLKLGLERLKRHVAAGQGSELLASLLRQVDVAGYDLRRVVRELRPAALAEFGLPAALRNLLEEWREASGIEVAFQCLGHRVGLLPEVEVTLFRLCQEALTNVSKHARDATRVSLMIDYDVDDVVLEVEDDGCGFDQAAARTTLHGGGFGLVGMMERVALIRGQIEVKSTKGEGTRIQVRIATERSHDA